MLLAVVASVLRADVTVSNLGLNTMWKILAALLITTPWSLALDNSFQKTTPRVFTRGYSFHRETEDPSVILREFFSSPSPFAGSFGVVDSFGEFSPPAELKKFFADNEVHVGFPRSGLGGRYNKDNRRFHRAERTTNGNARSSDRHNRGSHYRQSYHRTFGNGGRWGDPLDHSGHSGDGSSFAEVTPPRNGFQNRRTQQGGVRQNFDRSRPDGLVGGGVVKGYGVETVSRGPNSFSRNKQSGYERSYELNSRRDYGDSTDSPNGYFRSWSNSHGKSYSNNWSTDSRSNWGSSSRNGHQHGPRGQTNSFNNWSDNRSQPNRGAFNFHSGRSSTWTDAEPSWLADVRKSVLDAFRGV